MAYAYGDYPTKAEIVVREKDPRKAEGGWDALVAQRQAKAEDLSLVDTDGTKFWFVITPYLMHLVAKIAEHRGFLDAVSLSPQARSRLEKRAADLEAYFSSHIEGARSTLDEALAFMKTGEAALFGREPADDRQQPHRPRCRGEALGKAGGRCADLPAAIDSDGEHA
jgi:hypothetical protein